MRWKIDAGSQQCRFFTRIRHPCPHQETYRDWVFLFVELSSAFSLRYYTRTATQRTSIIPTVIPTDAFWDSFNSLDIFDDYLYVLVYSIVVIMIVIVIALYIAHWSIDWRADGIFVDHIVLSRSLSKLLLPTTKFDRFPHFHRDSWHILGMQGKIKKRSCGRTRTNSSREFCICQGVTFFKESTYFPARCRACVGFSLDQKFHGWSLEVTW